MAAKAMAVPCTEANAVASAAPRPRLSVDARGMVALSHQIPSPNHDARPADTSITDSHFHRASLSVGEPIGRVTRPFSVATGCSARLLRHFRAGTDARVAARGQAGGREHEPARRRTRVCSDGGG